MKLFFQSLTEIIRAMSPSIFAFIETTLPYTTPMPIALISSASAATFFGLKGFGAFLFVYSLEGIGLISTSKLVEHVVIFIRSRNVKTAIAIAVLAGTVVVYITILVSLNVKIHKEFTDENFKQALTLICYLPLLAGVLNGLTLVKIEDVNSAEYQNRLKEQHYQETRGDRVKLKPLDKAVNLFEQAIADQTAAPKTPAREKHASDYQDKIVVMLNAEYSKSGRVLSPSGICHLLKIDVDRNKGHVYRITKRWKEERDIKVVSE